MKLSKSLFLAFAGLGLFACSNEEVVDNGNKGNANVAVTINQSMLGSRSVEGPVADGALVDVKKMVVTLTAGGRTITQNVTPVEDQESYQVKFENVGEPTGLAVSVNDGASALTLTEAIIKSNAAAPLYGTVGTESFITEDEGQTYTVAITPAFQVSRLEITSIKHDKAGEDPAFPCGYESMKLQGVYLNKVDKANPAGEAGQFSFKGEDAWTTVQGCGTPIFDKFLDEDIVDKTYPTDGKVIAYNFFPQTKAPELVLVLKVKENRAAEEKTMYAKVTGYKVQGTDDPITKFEAGKVYKMNLVVPDGALTPDPEQPKDKNVTATVTILQWDAVNTDVTWN